MKKLLVIMELFYILVVMVVTQVYTFVKFFHMYTLKWVHIIVSKSYLNKVGLERKKKLHNSTCYDEPTCVKQKNNIHIFAFLCMQRRHLERYTRNLLVIRTWGGRVRRRLHFSYTLLFLTTCLY